MNRVSRICAIIASSNSFDTNHERLVGTSRIGWRGRSCSCSPVRKFQSDYSSTEILILRKEFHALIVRSNLRRSLEGKSGTLYARQRKVRTIIFSSQDTLWQWLRNCAYFWHSWQSSVLNSVIKLGASERENKVDGCQYEAAIILNAYLVTTINLCEPFQSLSVSIGL